MSDNLEENNIQENLEENVLSESESDLDLDISGNEEQYQEEYDDDKDNYNDYDLFRNCMKEEIKNLREQNLQILEMLNNLTLEMNKVKQLNNVDFITHYQENLDRLISTKLDVLNDKVDVKINQINRYLNKK